MLDVAIQNHLMSDAPLRALVGDRIYPDFAPLDCAIPYVLRQRLSNPGLDLLAGGQSEWRAPTYQFTIVATSAKDRDAIGERMKDRLRVSGALDQYDVVARVLAEVDQTEMPADGSDRRFLIRLIDFEFLHAAA